MDAKWFQVQQQAHTLPAFDVEKDLSYYFHQCSNMLKEGAEALHNADLEKAFIFYMKYTGLVKVLIPTHPQVHCYTHEWEKLQKDCEVLQKTVFSLRSQLEKQYTSQSFLCKTNQQFQSLSGSPASNKRTASSGSYEDFELSDSDSDEPAFLQGLYPQNNSSIKENQGSIAPEYDGSIARLRDALRSSADNITNNIKTENHVSLRKSASEMMTSYSPVQSAEQSPTGYHSPVRASSPLPTNTQDTKTQTGTFSQVKQHVESSETSPSLDSLRRLMQWSEDSAKNVEASPAESNSFQIPEAVEQIIRSVPPHPPIQTTVHHSIQTPVDAVQSSSYQMREEIPESQQISDEDIGQFVLVGNELKLINPSTGYPIELPFGVEIIPEHCILPSGTIPVPSLDDGSYVLPDGTQLIPIQVENISEDVAAQACASRLRQVLVDRDLFELFYDKAEANTRRGVQTQGLFVGPNPVGAEHTLSIQALVIPKQIASNQSCTIIHEEEFHHFLQTNNLTVFGWILIHPNGSTTLDPVDQHVQYQLQTYMPESIAVILSALSPHKESILHLTSNGMQFVGQCSLQGYHIHPEMAFVEPCTHIFVTSNSGACQIIDLR